MMAIGIFMHTWGTEVDSVIERLLYEVFVGEGYTNSDDASKLFVSGKLKRRGKAFVAIETSSGRIAGVIFYVPGSTDASQIANSQEAEIHLLAVHPLYQGSGLGKKLITACLDEAKRESVKRMVLSTQDSMKNAHRLYAQMGFKRNEALDWSRPGGGTYFVYEKAITQ